MRFEERERERERERNSSLSGQAPPQERARARARAPPRLSLFNLPSLTHTRAPSLSLLSPPHPAPLPTIATLTQLAAAASASGGTAGDPAADPQPAAPRGALHVGPGGITAPGLHVGPDGIALAAASGGQVLDPAAVAAAASMINAAIGAGGVRSLRLTPGTGLQFNAGGPDAVTLHASDGGLSLTAPLAAGAPGPAPAADCRAGRGLSRRRPGTRSPPQTATVRLRLPVSAGVAIDALPRLAFSIVPDPTGGAVGGAAAGAAGVVGAAADGGGGAVPGAAAAGGGPLAFLAGALG